MNLNPVCSLVLIALTVASLAPAAHAQYGTGTAKPEHARPAPIYLLCEMQNGTPVCRDDPGAQWMAGSTPKPQYLPRPEYPPRPLARGVAGWVHMEFTVTQIGAVEDAKVVESTPSSMFDAAALRLVRRFKYEPPTAAGEPIAVPGVTVRIVYDIERRRISAESPFNGSVRAEFQPLGPRNQQFAGRPESIAPKVTKRPLAYTGQN